ncbi:hypothetical protein BS47DRAFT_1484090 [Hydnum rufescens UP504]|uniref:Pentatricopeptide repeat protein n=1 Tax=Hydnum rufescens UP504 TaxID=1448309 RepID=A0A9P6DWB3_9AGAM|nr:hypothetical protein BS47DRAFT_1484090 [Hydnum rufescens UP504]
MLCIFSSLTRRQLGHGLITREFHAQFSLHVNDVDDTAEPESPASTSGASTRPRYERHWAYRELMQIIGSPHENATPDQTWLVYKELMDSSLPDKDSIPLHVHQSALRRCIPSTFAVRREARQRASTPLQHSPTLAAYYPYENRTSAVMENIRRVGYTADKKDYHLILNHYAAVGNVQGSLDLFDDLLDAGHTPDAQTYSYVLLCFARKIALGATITKRHTAVYPLIAEKCNELMLDMQMRNITPTPFILDLCTRVIGTTGSLEAFQRLLESVYGVDLDQPDSVPASFLTKYQQHVASGANPTVPHVSTATLNTIIRLLGDAREPSLSKIVSAFETLTAPLPEIRTPAQAYGYADADDDDPYLAPPSSDITLPQRQPAQPNSQTYTYLIQYAAKMGNKILARHFLHLALQDEKDQSERLRLQIVEILRGPRETGIDITPETAELIRALPHPTVSVNVTMFKIIYRLADDWTDVGLMAWLQYHERSSIRTKQKYSEFMRALLAALDSVLSEREPENSDSVESPEGGSQPSEGAPSEPEVENQSSFDLRAHLAVVRRQTFDLRQHIAVTNRNENSVAHHLIPKTNPAVDRLISRQIMRTVRTSDLEASDGEKGRAKVNAMSHMTQEMVERARHEWHLKLGRRRMVHSPETFSKGKKS